MPNLPVPVNAPRELPGVRHAYPHALEELDALAAVRAGDQFRWRGDHYLATADASDEIRDGWRRVFVQSCRTNPAMESGWALADISATRRVSSLDDIAENVPADRRDFAAELRDARESGDWGAHARIWEERRSADVDSDESAIAAPAPARPLLPRPLRRLLQVQYREAHAWKGYGKGVHGRINERAHVCELIGGNAEAGLVAIKWAGRTYCDSNGEHMTSESLIRVPALARPDEFWRLIDKTDPWIEGPASWHAAPPSTASRYAAEVESGK